MCSSDLQRQQRAREHVAFLRPAHRVDAAARATHVVGFGVVAGVVVFRRGRLFERDDLAGLRVHPDEDERHHDHDDF